MTELIFEKKDQTPRRKENKSFGMYDGCYKFSTQTTAVYSDYALIETENEIMKLNVSCDRVFYRKGTIGILRESKLELYKNKEYLKSYDVSGRENVNDISENIEDDLKKIESHKWVFYVDDEPLIVDSKHINFCGQSYINETHERDCKYFVAWKQGVAVLGNNKSLNLVYFCDKKRTEPDECFPVCFRTDEDTFDAVMIEDLKFYKDKLLAIDEDQVVTYHIKNYKLQDETTGKKVVEYSISDDKISAMELVCELSSENSREDSKQMPKTKEHSNNAEKEKRDIEMKLYLNDKGSEQSKDANGGKGQSLSMESVTNTVSQISSKSSENVFTAPPFDFVKSSIDLSKKDNKSDSKLYFQPDSKNATTACITKDFENNSLNKNTDSISSFSSLYKNTDSISSFNSFKSVISPKSKGQEHKSTKTDDQVKNLSESFSMRLDNLKNIFNKFGRKMPDIPSFKFLESKYDLSELYNCIFHNNVEVYTKALSATIVRLEALVATDYRNIEETISFFDSKILQIKSISFPVSYSHPLCSRFVKSVKISDQAENFIESFKILKIHTVSDKGNNSSSAEFSPKSKSAAAGGTAIPSRTVEKQEAQPSNHASVSNNKVSETFNKIPEASNKVSEATNKIPKATNIFGSSPSTFKDPSQSNSAYMPVDTGSLFRSVASNELRTDLIRDIHTDSSGLSPDPNQNQPVSAFNKFAGSRRLFK